MLCLQLPRQVSVICDSRHYAPVFLIARVSMLQQPKHRKHRDENYVAVYRPHHDQRHDRVDRVRCRPSGDRIVPPSGLPHKTRSVVILRSRQDEAALRRAHRWGFSYAVRCRPSPVPLCPRRVRSTGARAIPQYRKTEPDLGANGALSGRLFRPHQYCGKKDLVRRISTIRPEFSGRRRLKIPQQSTLLSVSRC